MTPYLVILSDSEVSIKLKCILKFYGFFANAQNDKVFMTNALIFFLRLCLATRLFALCEHLA